MNINNNKGDTMTDTEPTTTDVREGLALLALARQVATDAAELDRAAEAERAASRAKASAATAAHEARVALDASRAAYLAAAEAQA